MAFLPMMTPSLSPSPPLSIDDCRQAGEAFGQTMRGRSRQAFETALMQRLEVFVAGLAETGLDEEDAIAAFDVAAWDTWEAVLGGTGPAEPAAGEMGRPSGRARPKT